ncbi:MAG: DegV family protein [Opitutae bacterium]
MSTHHVSGYGLRRALIAGIQRVLGERDEINRINVYPVADHDTGTNLAFTLGGVLQGLREPHAVGVGELLARAAAESADSARGNSGVILAQFFQGTAETLTVGERLTGAKLARAVARGATLARAAMATPQEGTMVSVIQAFADEWQQPEVVPDIRHGFAAALARAQEVLRDTRQQIPALRSAGVVDAGAQGFVSLLIGIQAYITGGRRETIGAIPEELVSHGVDLSRLQGTADLPRYQAECVLSAERVDRTGLKAALLALPLAHQVITGTREQVRVHARTDDPAELFKCAARFGRVAGEKIADMRSASRRQPRVGIVTDTGADLPAGETARLDIHLVPQRLSVDGRDHIDRVSISPSEFFRAMRTSQISPRTSQPAPGDFRRMFEFLLTQHESVIDVSLTRSLSGTLQSAERVAARTAPGRVQVFDSGSVSCGQGLLAIWAAEAAQAGLTAPEILAGLARMRQRTKVYAFVQDIQYAVRGGRAPRVALTLTRLLHFSLLLTVRPTGRLGLLGGLWGDRNLPERFARDVVRRLDPGRRYRVLIGHSDCAGEAQRVQAALQASGLTLDRCWVVETGVAIGTHAGPGSLVIGVQDFAAPGR